MEEYLGHFHWGICQRLGSIPTMLLHFSAAKDLSLVLNNQQAKRHSVSVRKNNSIRRRASHSLFQIQRMYSMTILTNGTFAFHQKNISLGLEIQFMGSPATPGSHLSCALFVISTEGRCLDSRVTGSSHNWLCRTAQVSVWNQDGGQVRERQRSSSAALQVIQQLPVNLGTSVGSHQGFTSCGAHWSANLRWDRSKPTSSSSPPDTE